MTTQAVARRSPRKRFNPSEYRSDFQDLMTVNPTLAANAATSLAKSKRAAERELNAASDVTADLIALTISTGIVSLVGFWDGTVMARRDAILTSWEMAGTLGAGQEPDRAMWKAQGVKEPGKLFGFFPISLLIPIASFAAAMVFAGNRDEDEPAGIPERVFAVTAASTLGMWTAGLTRGGGYRWQQKRMIGAAADAAMTGT